MSGLHKRSVLGPSLPMRYLPRQGACGKRRLSRIGLRLFAAFPLEKASTRSTRSNRAPGTSSPRSGRTDSQGLHFRHDHPKTILRSWAKFSTSGAATFRGSRALISCSSCWTRLRGASNLCTGRRNQASSSGRPSWRDTLSARSRLPARHRRGLPVDHRGRREEAVHG